MLFNKAKTKFSKLFNKAKLLALYTFAYIVEKRFKTFFVIFKATTAWCSLFAHERGFFTHASVVSSRVVKDSELDPSHLVAKHCRIHAILGPKLRKIYVFAFIFGKLLLKGMITN